MDDFFAALGRGVDRRIHGHPINHAADRGGKGQHQAENQLAVERVQRGIQARAYQGGRMCFRFEESIHRFQNIVIDLMTGAALQWKVVDGNAARATGWANANPNEEYLQVTLPRPVPRKA